VFWTGSNCGTHFIDVYPTASYIYSITFSMAFFFLAAYCAREIFKYLTELDESAKKSVAAAAQRGADVRRRSSSVQFNRPKSLGRTTFVQGFFQPTRVRFLVMSCCFLGSLLRFIYVFNVTLRICYEGEVCGAVVFEPANVCLVSAALLTVMFWKKMGMMFKKGINRSNQYEDDLRFFQIFGFYFLFQFTMIVTQSTAAAMGIDVTALYDISLVVSGIYITMLLIGAVKFGYTLVKLLRGSSKGKDATQSKDARQKTWKKIRKVVIMLAWTVPGSTLYMIALVVYIGGGMRQDVTMWMPMQPIFRTLEVSIIWGLCSCLATRKATANKHNPSSSAASTTLSPSTRNFFSKSLSGVGGAGGMGRVDSRHISVIKEAQEEHILRDDSIETHVV